VTWVNSSLDENNQQPLRFASNAYCGFQQALRSPQVVERTLVPMTALPYAPCPHQFLVAIVIEPGCCVSQQSFEPEILISSTELKVKKMLPHDPDPTDLTGFGLAIALQKV
jgi:hypothetical protein